MSITGLRCCLGFQLPDAFDVHHFDRSHRIPAFAPVPIPSRSNGFGQFEDWRRPNPASRYAR